MLMKVFEQKVRDAHDEGLAPFNVEAVSNLTGEPCCDCGVATQRKLNPINWAVLLFGRGCLSQMCQRCPSNLKKILQSCCLWTLSRCIFCSFAVSYRPIEVKTQQCSIPFCTEFSEAAFEY